jgi:hypothetical protein
MTSPRRRGQPAEEAALHTRILRCTLAAEESQAYWEHVDLAEPAERRNLRAFEERWFGVKSQAAVKVVLANLSARFDAYPAAFATLRGWRAMPPATRRLFCHWHLQLTDPIYRRFTGELLVQRREGARPSIDRDLVSRWVEQQAEGRWGAATRNAFGTKLLSTALEVGLVEGRRDPRRLAFPRVDDDALVYLLRLLRTVSFSGSILANPYLSSVGLFGPFLEQRLRALPGLAYRRVGDVIELEWVEPQPSALQAVKPATIERERVSP